MPESLVFPIRNGLGVSNDRFGLKAFPLYRPEKTGQNYKDSRFDSNGELYRGNHPQHPRGRLQCRPASASSVRKCGFSSEGRLQCRPASASSVRKCGFSSEKPFGKLLAQTCKRLVLGVFSFFCHLFFLFSPLSKEKENQPCVEGAFAVPARQCIQRPQVRIFIRKRGFLFLLPPFLSLFAPFKRERKGLFVHLQV